MNCIPKTYFESTKKKDSFSVLTYVYMCVVCDYLKKKIPSSFFIYLM